jgi:hypothetical protein
MAYILEIKLTIGKCFFKYLRMPVQEFLPFGHSDILITSHTSALPGKKNDTTALLRNTLHACCQYASRISSYKSPALINLLLRVNLQNIFKFFIQMY